MLASIHAAAPDLSLSHEIVVADDASTDGTASAAFAAGACVIALGARSPPRAMPSPSLPAPSR